ncbi:MAG TPA: hypothetical protein V6D22_15785, partial [Candidatus Obscuribacterales bacterium]
STPSLILGTYNRAVEDAIDRASESTNLEERARLFDKAGELASKYLVKARAMQRQKYICLAFQELAKIYELTNRPSDAIPCRSNADAEFKKYLSQPNAVDEQANYECYRITNLFVLSVDYELFDISQSRRYLEEADRAAREYHTIENGELGLSTNRGLYDQCERLGDLLYARGDIDGALSCYKLQKAFASTQPESREALTRVKDKIARLSKHS